MENGTMTGKAVLRGLAAGVVGVAAMTVAEKIEQVFTHRPNSFVPAHTLERCTRVREFFSVLYVE
jgi:hypothetical protein